MVRREGRRDDVGEGSGAQGPIWPRHSRTYRAAYSRLKRAVGSVFTGWLSHPPILNIYLLSLIARFLLRLILQLAEFLSSLNSWSHLALALGQVGGSEKAQK